MNKEHSFLKMTIGVALLGVLAGCGEPRAVMLPLQYPDGSAVTNMKGEPVMAGYQTYGSAMHANATALYESARSPSCATCARVGAVVSEPSNLRQITGVLGTGAVGAGTVMGGIGAMDYGTAAREGKLGTNVTQSSSATQSSTATQSSSSASAASAAASAAAASNSDSSSNSGGEKYKGGKHGYGHGVY